MIDYKTQKANAEKIQLLNGNIDPRNYSKATGKQIASGQGIFNCFPIMDTLTDNATKIIIEARTIVSQASCGRSPKPIKKGASLAMFRFIAPSEITETISHTWESYESMASKVAELAASATKLKTEFKGLPKKDDFVAAINNNNTFWSEDNLRNWFHLLQNADVAQTRVDMPLIYKDTEKRRYEFAFQLGCYNDPNVEILIPVKALETLSCPSLPGSGTDDANIAGITAPCIFSISTEPDTGLIYIANAALLTVQPTYKGPFYNGYPTSCDLHLTFQEIEPLWDTMFVKDGKNPILVTESK